MVYCSTSRIVRTSSSFRGSRFNKKRVAFLAIIGLLIVPIIQLLSVHLELLLSGQTMQFELSSDDFEKVGSFRYIKDVYFLLFGILWPALVFTSRNNFAKRCALIFLSVESLIISIGLIGHLLDPILPVVLAGMRWVLVLHVGLGVFALATAYELWEFKANRRLNLIITLILLTSVTVAILQRLLWGNEWGITDIRVSSFYANSGVYGFILVGIAIYFFISERITKSQRFYLFGLIGIGTILCGSRSAMILVFMLLIVMALMRGLGRSNSPRSRSKTFVLSLVLPILLMLVLIPVAEIIAQRGSILEAQKEEGRISIAQDVAISTSDLPIFYQFFGKGIGYGTNTAHILYGESSSEPWFMIMDSTLMPLYVQFGILGLIGVLWLITYAVRYLMFSKTLNPRSKIIIFYLGIVLLVLSFTQNIFENPSFLVLFTLTLALLLQKHTSCRPSLNET